MFWGLVLQPGKRYTSVVQESFHLSAAAVDTASVGRNEAGVFPVQVEVEGQKMIICNLSNQCLHLSVDLYFDKGTELTFMTPGKATIHLTGYTSPEDDSEEESTEESESSDNEDLEKSIASYHRDMKGGKKNKPQKESAEKRKSTSGEVIAAKKPKVEGPESSDADESSEDGFENMDLADFSLSDDDEENDDEEDGYGQDDDMSDEDSEVAEDSDSGGDAASAKKKKKKKPQQLPQTPKSKKEQLVSSDKQNKTPGSSKKPEKLNKSKSQDLTNGMPTKAEKKAQKKSLSKGEVKTPKGNESVTSSSQSPKKQSMEGGVVVEELKTGNGPVAKPGKMVAVYYTGRLKNNNRVFDQSNSGQGFKFRLGKGEVIKGWDVALNGMKVGSKRRITCPPAMAYGAKGCPPSIPSNSSLIFDVELKSVN